ncbi:MAG: hypothetical protein HY719_03335 [Planctomycetes bacterium]|nr:hypothetical protein [Planctomycetota bacterium]
MIGAIQNLRTCNTLANYESLDEVRAYLDKARQDVYGNAVKIYVAANQFSPEVGKEALATVVDGIHVLCLNPADRPVAADLTALKEAIEGAEKRSSERHVAIGSVPETASKDKSNPATAGQG